MAVRISPRGAESTREGGVRAAPATPGVAGDDQRRCDNPSCLNLIHWTRGRGRPTRYCSDRCRQSAKAGRARLAMAATTLRATLGTSPTYRQQRALESELARITWLMSAYPTADGE